MRDTVNPFSTKRICFREAKTKIQQCDWLAKKFAATFQLFVRSNFLWRILASHKQADEGKPV